MNKWINLLSKLSKIELDMINPKHLEVALSKYKKILGEPTTFEIWKDSLTMDGVNKIFEKYEYDYLTGSGFNRYKNHSAEEVIYAYEKFKKKAFEEIKKEMLESIEEFKKIIINKAKLKGDK